MKLSGKQLTTAVLIGLMGISAGGVVMAKPPVVQSQPPTTGGQQDPNSNPQGAQPPAGGQGTQTPATPNPVQDSNHIDFTGFLKLINQNSDDIKANKNSISALQDKVNQITGSGSTAPNLDKLQQDVKNLQDTVGADDNSGLKKDVKDIKTEVGDDNSGLKKDVKDIKTEVGDDNSGLKKDVKDIKTEVGDDNSGLKKDVKDIKTEVGDDNSGLKKDVKALQDTVGADDQHGLKKELKNIQTEFGSVNTDGLKKDVHENKVALAKKADTDKVNTALGLKADKSELADYVRKSDLKIGNNAKDIQKVGARAAALAGLHPLEFDPSTKLSFAVSSGSYDGENSVAFGAFYRPTKNVMLSAASTMGSKNAYTFGMSFKFGESSATTTTNTPDVQELYRVVGQLQYQVAAQQQEIQQLRQAAKKTK